MLRVRGARGARGAGVNEITVTLFNICIYMYVLSCIFESAGGCTCLLKILVGCACLLMYWVCGLLEIFCFENFQFVISEGKQMFAART